MSFLQNLANKAQQLGHTIGHDASAVANTASRVYDQVNPLDNGLSIQTRQVNPAAAQQSVAQQVWRNPVVQGVASAPMYFAKTDLINPTRELAAQFSHNPAAYQNAVRQSNIDLGLGSNGRNIGAGLRKLGGNSAQMALNVVAPGAAGAIDRSFANVAAKVVPGLTRQVVKDGITSNVAKLPLRALSSAGSGAVLGAPYNATATLADTNQPFSVHNLAQSAVQGAKYGAVLAAAAPVAGALASKGANTTLNAADKAKFNTLEKTGQRYNGLKPQQIITNPDHLQALDQYQSSVYDKVPPPVKDQQRIQEAMHQVKQTNGLDFLSGSAKDRADRIANYQQQWHEGIARYQNKLMQQQDNPSVLTDQNGGINNKGASNTNKLQQQLGQVSKAMKAAQGTPGWDALAKKADTLSGQLEEARFNQASAQARKKGLFTPLDQAGGGAVKDSPIRKALQGEKQQLPTINTGSKDLAASRFPLRVSMDERAAPIQPTLDKLSIHDVKHNAPVLRQTAAAIAKNEDQALTLAKRGTSTEANATAMQLLNKYLAEGNTEKADDLVQTISPRFTRQGQETQILAAYSRLTPAGAVRYAQKQLEKAAEKTGKGQKLEDATVQAHKAVQDNAKQVADQVAKEVSQGNIAVRRPRPTQTQAKNAIRGEKAAKTPEQMLADRIKTGVSQKKQGPDPIKDMVDTLHKVAKEVIPEQLKKNPRNPMELVGKAIKDKTRYADVWDKAQKLVAEKYKDNPHALEELDKYFQSSLARPFSKGQLNRGVQQGLKGVDLGKLVKDHYTKVDAAGTELKDKLIKEAGLSPSEATQLSGDIQKRYSELVQQRKDSILKQMFGDRPTPEQTSAADRILAMHNLGAMSRDELRPLVAQKLGLKTLTPEVTSTISRMADAIQRLPEGSAQRMQATAEMMKYIAQQVPQHASNQALSVWKAGLLSGVKTQGGNFASNATFGALHGISNLPATAIDKGISLVTGNRTKTLTGRGYGSGAVQGARTGLDTMRTGIDMRNIMPNKYEVHGELQFNNKLANSLVAKTTNFVFRGMSAADQPFYFAAFKNNLVDMAKADGINQGLKGAQLEDHIRTVTANPPTHIAEAATLAAQKSVLSQDSKIASSVSQFAQNHPAAQLLVPFVKVPTNFLTRTLDFTPVGAIKEVSKQIRAGKFDQRAFSEAIGEATTGSAVIYLGAELANSNLLSGQYPQNDQKEQQRWKTEGIQPNSVKVGNTWISLNYLGPVGLLLGAGKDYHDAAVKGDNGTIASIAGFGKNLTGQSFLTGFSGFANAINDPQRSAKSFINSQVGSVVPSISNDVANLFDSKQRQASTPLQQAQSRIPYARNQLPVKQDVYGNPLTQRTNPLNLLANPLKPSDVKTNDVTQEVERLHNADPNNKDLQVTPTPVQKKFKVDGQPVTLNDKQAYDLQKQVGQATQDAWSKLIASPEYQKLSDTDKANALNKARQGAAELAQRQYVTSNNLGTYSKQASANARKVAGGDLTQFAKAKSAGSGTGIAKNLPDQYKSVLNDYNNLDAKGRQDKLNSQNDYEFKLAEAKYQNDKASGKITSDVADMKRQQELGKLQIGSQFSKEARDAYSLTKPELTAYLNNHPDKADQLYSEIQAYDNAQYQAGARSSLKFKNGLATKTSGGSRKGSGGVKRASSVGKAKLPNFNNSANISRTASLTKKVASTTVKGASSGKKVAFSTKIKAAKPYKLAKITKGKVA